VQQVSIELPEAHILAMQMHRALVGKEIADCRLANCATLQKIVCVNKNLTDFNRLVGLKVDEVVSRGNVIKVKAGGLNMIFAPEYGGRIQFYPKESDTPVKFHLKLVFTDGSALTVILTGVGVIQVFPDGELQQSYVYRRDFSTALSPMDPATFTCTEFSKALSQKNVNVKAALVGKDAVVVGLSNSAFQDILFRACIHPKRKASNLKEQEKQALYDAIKTLADTRVRGGSKTQFTNLHGKQGTYVAAMGSNMKNKPCPACGCTVVGLSLGGGQVFCCPNCQK
jgi:formamidopyrimidine-DNA glycosylase